MDRFLKSYPFCLCLLRYPYKTSTNCCYSKIRLSNFFLLLWKPLLRSVCEIIVYTCLDGVKNPIRINSSMTYIYQIPPYLEWWKYKFTSFRQLANTFQKTSNIQKIGRFLLHYSYNNQMQKFHVPPNGHYCSANNVAANYSITCILETLNKNQA